jgi:hypothetical protein
MSDTKFDEIVGALCEAAGLQEPDTVRSKDGIASISLDIGGVSVSLLHVPHVSEHDVVSLVEFGPIPPDQELAAWKELMSVNFLMRKDGGMSFGRSAEGGEVVLQCAHPMEAVTGPRLLEALVHMSELARKWRKDFFLGESPVSGLQPLHPYGRHRLNFPDFGGDACQ